MKATKKQIPVFDGNLFSWTGKIGTSELSSLPDFAAEEQFKVRSHKTGVEKLFSFKCPRRIQGDVMSLVFKSDDGFTVEIFND